MAVIGVGEGYAYQNNSRQGIKNMEKGSFLKEMSGAVKRAEEKKEGNVSQTKAGSRENGASSAQEEMMREIREKMQELHEKILKGETQQSFQIGGSSFTLNEWERFIENFDESEKDFEEQLKEFMEMQKEAAMKNAMRTMPIEENIQG